MDQRSHTVEQDLKDIAQTRLEISRKMHLLDEEIRAQLQGIKVTSSGIAAIAAEIAKDVGYTTARMLNPARQLDRRPLAVLAGVVLFGYAISMLEKRLRRPKVYPYYPPETQGVPIMPSESKEGEKVKSGVYPYFPERRGRSSFPADAWDEIKNSLQTEIRHSQKAVMYSLRAFARNAAKQIVPALLGSLQPRSRISRR
ncbi:MAG: hypothetical protein NDI90_21195 [Nitrospira sp. BO4]|jgi:hypothetical protein|nr:hypothetical protein [Nitrospira sp. BO4]